MDKRDITVDVVSALLRDQFPRWADLAVRPVDVDGNDNTTFRLGEDLLVRLPSHERYVAAVEKEHRWLPVLAPRLPIPIPAPVAKGHPKEGVFPRVWSVYRWIDGQVASVDPPADMTEFAIDVAGFLDALHRIDTTGGPPAGEHNFHRGAPLRHYDDQTRRAIADLGGVIDVDGAAAVWHAAIHAPFTASPVWVHGDVAQNNLLVKDGHLHAVIDFGTSGVGDPACDTVLAWTYLEGESRQAFRQRLPVDDGTWARGRGWAIWKAVITLAWNTSAEPAFVQGCQRVVSAVIAEHRSA